jgi:hypothetical protein
MQQTLLDEIRLTENAEREKERSAVGGLVRQVSWRVGVPAGLSSPFLRFCRQSHSPPAGVTSFLSQPPASGYPSRRALAGSVRRILARSQLDITMQASPAASDGPPPKKQKRKERDREEGSEKKNKACHACRYAISISPPCVYVPQLTRWYR